MATTAPNPEAPRVVPIPTEAECAAALEGLSAAATSLVAIALAMRTIGTWPDRSDEMRRGLALPKTITLEDVGRLYIFLGDARSRLNELGDYVSDAECWLPHITPEHLAWAKSGDDA